jgi:hypothetical protein
MVLADSGLETLRESILTDPTRLSEFLRQWKLAEKELAEPVFAKAREIIAETPDAIPGWKATSVKGREFFDHVAITRAAAAGKASLDSLVLALGGTMGGAKFRQWCADMKVNVEESLARTGEPTTQLRQDRKKLKTNN